MVSIVIGSGAGLVNTSKELIGSGGELGQASMGRAGERLTVNAATGNLVVQDRDEYLVGVGPDVDLLRTYNSQGGWDGDNGDGWRIGYYRRVEGLTGGIDASGSTIKRTDADGHEAVYTFDSSSGRYRSTDGGGQYDNLSYSAGTWTWTDGDTGVTERYEEGAVGSGNFRLTQVEDAQGRKIVVGYDAGGLISTLGTFKAGSVTADETVTLSYTGTQLTQVSTSHLDSAGTSRTRSLTRYEYEPGTGKLNKVTTDLTPEDSSVTDGKSYAVSYTYDANGRLKTLTQTDGSQATVDYYSDGRVKSIADLTGETLFTYDTVARKTTVKDALGQFTTLTYNSANRLLEISGSATGGSTIKQSYEYNTAGDLIASTNGRNETTIYEYTSASAPGALTRRTDAAGNVLERSYATGGLLESETIYSGASVLGAAPTGPQTTRYFYDTSSIAKRQLAYVLGPQGQVTRNVYNASGQLASQYRYADAAYTGTASFAALETWATVTQASSAQREYTEYFYDLRGQLQEERSYAAVPAPAPAATPAYTRIRYSYDAFGRLLSRLNHDEFGTTYAYDGLNRLTLATDASGAKTTYSYDDQNRKTTLTLDNGQYTTQIYDKQGNLLSTETFSASASGLGTSKYRYDALGRLRNVDDPTGQRIWMLYEPSGRKVADIAANGQLTEYAYDAAGNLVQSIAYATLVSAAQLATLSDASGNPTAKGLADIRPAADSARDRITTQYYDKAGRLTGVLDADGYLTETQYDGRSAITGQTRYATAQSVTRLSTTASSFLTMAPTLTRPAADELNDRVLRNVYNASGQLAASIDGEGVLTRWTYDLAGHQRTQQRSAVVLNASQRAGSLPELQAIANAADDELRQYFYDNQGRLISELDAEGNLTDYSYDAVGRLSSTSRYLTQAVRPVILGTDGKYQLNLKTRDTLDTLRPSLGMPLSTGLTYNSRGLLETETAVDGSVTKYVYDNLQRLKTSTRALGSSDETTAQIKYDDWGRVNQEVDGENGVVEYSYDAAGRRSSIKDARGNFTYLYYDKTGRQVYAILKDPLLGGEVRETIYSSFNEVAVTVSHSKRLALADCATLSGGLADAGLTSKIALLNDATRDQRSEAVFNRRGLIQQAIDALSFKTDITYNAFGQVQTSTSDVDAARRLTSTLGYDRRGLLKQATQTAVGGPALSVITKTDYDAFGRVSLSTDALNQTTSYEYLRNDGTGRKLRITDPAGQSTTTYDAIDRVLERKDRNGNTVSYTHDTANRKLTIKTAEGIQTVTEYTQLGQVWKLTDGTLATTTYAYDDNGNLLSITDALGNVTQYHYDASGNRDQVTLGLKANAGAAATNDGSGIATSYSFDAANRVLTQSVDPTGLNLQTKFEYDGQGRQVKITDARGTVTTQAFNAKGELTDVVVDSTGLALKTSYSYDAQSRTVSVTEGAGTSAARKTAYEYDVLGRRTAEIVDPTTNGVGLNLRTSYEYDAAGHVVLKRDALNQVNRFRYDTAGRLQFSIDGTGAVTRSLYDAESHLTGNLAYATRLAAGWEGKTNAALDLDLASLATSAGDQLSSFAYDKDGRLIYSVDAGGSVTVMQYDDAGRVLLSRQCAGVIAVGAAPKSLADIKSLLTRDDAADRVTRFAYDAIGRQVYAVDALGGVTETRYGRTGLVINRLEYAKALSSTEAANDKGMGQIYSLAGLITDVKKDATNDRVEQFAYDAAGRQRFKVDAEGYVTETRYDDASGVTTSLRYATRISGALAYAPSATPRSLASFTTPVITGLGSSISNSRSLDRAGRMSAEVDGNGVVTAYGYDAASRRTTVTQASGLAEQVVTRYTYDAADRMTQRTVADGTTDASTTRYEYDALGQLKVQYDARGVEASETNSDWAKAERVRRGYPAELSVLTYGQKLTLLNVYRTEYEYDAAGHRTVVHNMLRQISSFSYDAFGNVTRSTDYQGNPSYFYYDALNRQSLSVDAEGFATKFSYDPRFPGAATTITRYQQRVLATEGVLPALVADVKDAVTTNSYDRLGRLAKSVDAENYSESVSVDSANRFDRTTTNKLNGQTTAHTDRRGQVLTETLPVTVDGASVVNLYEYDAWGNCVKSVEASGLTESRTTTYRYDGEGRQVLRLGTAFQALDTATLTKTSKTPAEQTIYDALGRPVEFITNAQWDGTATVGGQRHLSYYSATGLKTAEVGPDGAMVVTQYDTAGYAYAETRYAAPVSLPPAGIRTKPTPVATPGKDRTSLMSYDAMGRLVQRQVMNLRYWEPGSDDVKFTTALQDPGIVTVQRLLYDANGNVIEEDDALGNAVLSYYDKLGRRTVRVDQEGYVTAWKYDSFHDHATKQVRFAQRVGAGLDNLDTLLLLAPSVDNRITEFDLDHLGRVSEQRVLNVATQFVDATGQVAGSTSSAVTKTQYNGLGLVTQTREYVGKNAGGTEVWNQTDFSHDALGRETQRIAQGFTDYQGIVVRPETDTVYNGYGAVSRRTEVGRVSTEDRVTKYHYDANGERIKVTDPQGNVTDIELNAQGQAARVTYRDVLSADGTTADVAKTFEYDAAGRQSAVKDFGTSEIRRTRFNAFGQVEARGLGSDWQEYTEYNVLGKVERTNSGDGAAKLYLYDRTGNATRLIKSAGTADLRSVALGAAAADSTLNHSFSAYDRRGLLIKTADIKVSYLTDATALQAAYSQKLTDFYGAISLSKIDASNGSTFAVNPRNTSNLAVPTPSTDVSTLVPTDSRSVIIASGSYVQIPINYAGSLLNQTAVTVQMQIDGIAVSGSLASGYFTVTWSEMAGKGVDVGSFASRAVGYRYLVFVAPTVQTSRINFAGEGVGTFQTGRASTVTAPSTYLPWLKLPGAKNVGWNVPNTGIYYTGGATSVYNGGNGVGYYNNMIGLDLRRYLAGTDTILNLQDFILPPGSGTNTVTITYNTLDTAYTLVVQVSEKGRVTIVSTTPRPLGAATVILPLNGASTVTTFKRVKLTTGNENPRDVALNEVGLVSLNRNWLFKWNTAPADAGTWAYYIESDDGNGHMATSGTGTYTVAANGTVSQASFTADAVPAYVNFAPPAGTAAFKVSYRRKGSSGAWTTVSNTTGLVNIGGGKWQLKANALMPLAGDPDTVTYEYTFEAANAGGGLVSKGGGDLVAQRSGVVGAANTYQDRLPLQPINFSGPIGRKDAAKVRLTYTPIAGGAAQTVTLTGTWSGSDLTGSYQYRWDNPFGGQSFAAETRFGFKMELLTSAGVAAKDDSGNPIEEKGEMSVGASADSPFQLKQLVQTLNKSAQVKHLQTWNAFGEIDSEYDERTLDRATAMVQLYKSIATEDFTPSLNQSALTTRLSYNTLGKLIAKNDPTAFETLENGYIRRASAQTQYGYDLVGRMTVSVDANGNDTRMHYEGAGEADNTQWLPSAGSGTANDPFVEAKRVQRADIFGDARVLIDELNQTTEQRFDRNRNLVEVKKVGVTRAKNFTAGEFDDKGVNFKGANGVAAVDNTITTSYVYDALGRRIKRTDALNQSELTWYDGQDRVIKVRSAAGRDTTYGYQLIAAGDASANKVLGLGGANVGGFVRTTTHADGGTLTDKIEYFGNTTSHVDLGGNKYTYSYDLAGQLQSQTSERAKAGATGQNIEYSYLQNGMLAEIRDLAKGQLTLTRYGYDDAGNRTYEEYAQLAAKSDGSLDTSKDAEGRDRPKGWVSKILQASTIVYDERNRIARVADGIDAGGAAVANAGNASLARSHDLRYEYDAVGNRRAAYYRYWDPLADGGAGKLLDTQNYYYTYDRANRFLITKGNLTARGSSATDTTQSIVLGLEGTRLGYDAAGQRISALHTDGSQEVYTYSSDGYLEDTLIKRPGDATAQLSARRRVDAIGRTRDYVEYRAVPTDPAQREIKQRRITAYDAENRTLAEHASGGTAADHSEFSRESTYEYYTTSAQATYSKTGAGALARVTDESTGLRTKYTYELWDTAKQASIEIPSGLGRISKSTLSYDANGHLAKTADDGNSREIGYIANAQGLVMQRMEFSTTDPSKSYSRQYFYAAGVRVGDVGTDPEDKLNRVSYVEQLATALPRDTDPAPAKNRMNAFAPITSADFDQSYEPINAQYPAAAGVNYVARAGETLRGIAQAFWGDRSMWYLLAEANGLRDDTQLAQGQVIVIPNKVTNIHNNASTFRPYNPGEVIGHIQPGAPGVQMKFLIPTFYVGENVSIPWGMQSEEDRKEYDRFYRPPPPPPPRPTGGGSGPYGGQGTTQSPYVNRNGDHIVIAPQKTDALGNAIGSSIAEPSYKTLSDVGGTSIQRIQAEDIGKLPRVELQDFENLKLPSLDVQESAASSGLTAAQRRAMELGLGPLSAAAAQEGMEALDGPLGPAANGRPMPPSKEQVAASAAIRARLAQKSSDYWGGTGEYAPTVKDNKTLASALKDTGRAIWNLGVDALDIADTISPVGYARRTWARSNGNEPISPSDFRAIYDTPSFGATLEVLAPFVPLSRLSTGFKTLGGAAFADGKFLHDLKPLSNLELYGTSITRTPDEAVQLLRSVGHDAETLAEYRFVKLSPQEYSARVDRLGFEFDATYGNVPRDASSVRFSSDIASQMADGSSRINVYVRDAVFESDEALVQILSHEIHETQALKYAAARPISVKEYSDLVRSNLNGNLHWEAVQEGDYWLQQFRLKNGKQ